MKNSNDTIGNRTRDLPACSAVPQPMRTPSSVRSRFMFSASPFTKGRKKERKKDDLCKSSPVQRVLFPL